MQILILLCMIILCNISNVKIYYINIIIKLIEYLNMINWLILLFKIF